MSDEKIYPTWGYRKGENGQPDGRIFDLGTGEDLPDGWVDTPAKLKEEAAAPDPAPAPAPEPTPKPQSEPEPAPDDTTPKGKAK